MHKGFLMAYEHEKDGLYMCRASVKLNNLFNQEISYDKIG